jgi:Fungal specific transcription factor domain
LFFQEWQPLLPVLHRPTFLRVYEQYLAGPDAGNWHSSKHAIAQLFLIFEISALSCGHQQRTSTPSYENQWRRALYSTSSAPTISTIQSQVLAQLCYLLKADYTHLARHRGIAVGMCHELGLHQSHKYHSLSAFEAETRKKVFWCQYVLDKFTSAATGAPTLLREDDITTDYPSDVDDENLSVQGVSPSLPGEITKISSALAFFKCARILSKTLEHLYPAKASYQLSRSKLHALSDELDQWSEELPEHLRLRFCNDKPATNLISCRSPILVSHISHPL